MGRLGIGEIALILFICFLIIPPEKIPHIVRRFRKEIRKFLKIKDEVEGSIMGMKETFNEAVKPSEDNEDKNGEELNNDR